MVIRDLQQCDEFIAGDNSVLRELLHPDKADLKIGYSLAHAVIKPGQISLPHKIRHSEVYYILEGEGIMTIDDETSAVHHGQAVYIPPMGRQFIQNTGTKDLVFLCIVDPAWRKEDEVVL